MMKILEQLKAPKSQTVEPMPVVESTREVFAKYRNGVYCTAGTSYVVIAPNGDAFACMTDLEANKKAPFNVYRDGWSPRSRPYRCSYPTCSGCDVPYVARWFQDDEGATTQSIERVWPHGHVTKRDNPETLADISGQTKSLTWLPSQVCNFTCVYCDYGNGKSFTHQRYPMSKDELDVDQWMKVWTNILEHVEYATVTISGGEPTMSEAFAPIVELISGRYLVNITTNGSQNLLRLARQTKGKHNYQHPVLGAVNVGLDQVNLSLHPSSRNYDEQIFRGNALLLENSGFNVMVNFVGYPSQLFLTTEHRKWCEDNDIPFMLLEWGNGDRFGNHASYTEKERDFFNANVTHDRRVNARETPVGRHSITIKEKPERLSRNEVGTVSGQVTNTSDFVWKVDGGLGHRVGGRLYRARRGEEGWKALLARRTDGPLAEVRCELANGVLAPGATSPFVLNMDCSKLAPGYYDFSVDIVDDGKFWFGQIGSMPITITFQVV